MENYDGPAYSQVRPDGLVVLVWGIFDPGGSTFTGQRSALTTA